MDIHHAMSPMDVLISGSMHMNGAMYTSSASQWLPLQYQPYLALTFTSYCNTFISILVILIVIVTDKLWYCGNKWTLNLNDQATEVIKFSFINWTTLPDNSDRYCYLNSLRRKTTLRGTRGILMNIGFFESMNFSNWDCFVFHDVDHVPMSDYNYYGCTDMPKHFLTGSSEWNYR